MIDTKKLSPSILMRLHKRGHTDDYIEKMTSAQAFDECCQCEGLIGWGPTLRDWIKDINNAMVNP